MIARSDGETINSFVRDCQTSPQWLYPFVFSQAMNGSCCCSASLSAFGVIDYFGLVALLIGVCYWVSHRFSLHFPYDLRSWASSHMLVICIFLVKSSHVFSVLIRRSSLCILHLSSLYFHVHSFKDNLFMKEVFNLNVVQFISPFLYA